MERKVAVVTAAAGAGIGLAVVEELARSGMDVVVTDAHGRRCQELAERLSAKYERPFLGLPLDVTDYEAVGQTMKRVFEHYGRIDVLVNNAGWSKIEPVWEMSPETWQKCLGVILNGAFHCIRQTLPYMIQRQSGAVVSIASTAAWETADYHGAAYSAAKAGITALTRVAAAEAGKHGIRVNCVAPGLIYNDFLRRIYPDSYFEEYAHRTAIGRVGTPQDVASLVGFLVSDQAGFITGEVYALSGGVAPHA